jgi:hypothetical protein
MAMELFFTTKEEGMLEIGGKIKWKEREFFTILITQ